ncbi:MAG: MarR family transcriptional regulator [Arachnia sp.]
MPTDIHSATTANELLRLAARLSRWASASTSFEVPFAQARLLALIDELGPVRVSALADADHSSQPTVTGQVDRLVASGLVVRETDPTDARASLVSLTDDGGAALVRMRAARADVLNPVIAQLDGEGTHRVRVAVDVLSELLDLASSSAPLRKDR